MSRTTRAERATSADDAFDAVRIDRSLQHAERPDQVIMEMTRVAKGGGVVFAVEPDWGTFVLYNGDDKTSDLLVREWTRSIRNPSIGRELQQLFACAMHNITVRAHPLILTDYPSAAAVYDLERLLSHCVSQNILSASEASNWKARSEKATEANYFFSHLCIVEVVGVA